MQRIKGYLVFALVRMFSTVWLDPKKASDALAWCLEEAGKEIYPDENSNGYRKTIRFEWMHRFACRLVLNLSKWVEEP